MNNGTAPAFICQRKALAEQTFSSIPGCLIMCICCHVCQDAAPCSGELLESIKAKWGSLDNFIATFNTTTAAVQVGCSCSLHALVSVQLAHSCDVYGQL